MTTTRTLVQADRCDRCTAAALVLVTVECGELQFCAHHFNGNADALFEAGATVIDDQRLQLAHI